MRMGRKERFTRGDRYMIRNVETGNNLESHSELESAVKARDFINNHCGVVNYFIVDQLPKTWEDLANESHRSAY